MKSDRFSSCLKLKQKERKKSSQWGQLNDDDDALLSRVVLNTQKSFAVDVEWLKLPMCILPPSVELRAPSVVTLEI
eukprot:scaffold18509_cov158-Skeletonema_menzelii.AAC.7